MKCDRELLWGCGFWALILLLVGWLHRVNTRPGPDLASFTPERQAQIAYFHNELVRLKPGDLIELNDRRILMVVDGRVQVALFLDGNAILVRSSPEEHDQVLGLGDGSRSAVAIYRHTNNDWSDVARTWAKQGG